MLTAYQTYVVRARTPEEAAARVRDDEQRGELEWFPAGWGDDEEVLAECTRVRR